MEEKISITELYRQIGNMLHKAGADRAVLVRARECRETQKRNLEIAVDGILDSGALLQECRQKWPMTDITLLDLDADENLDLLDEALEDGILL